jgi:hypothetical protein
VTLVPGLLPNNGPHRWQVKVQVVEEGPRPLKHPLTILLMKRRRLHPPLEHGQRTNIRADGVAAKGAGLNKSHCAAHKWIEDYVARLTECFDGRSYEEG